MKQLTFWFVAISLARGDSNLNYESDKELTLSGCQRKSDLYDTDGNYIKSVCQSYDAFSFENGEKFCVDNGMLLFVLSDSRTEKALYQFANSVWPKYFGAAFWANGKWNKYEQQWRTVPLKNLLSNDLKWNEGSYDDDYIDYTDSCLRTSNIRGDFSLDGYYCETTMTVFCEYDCRNDYLCTKNITKMTIETTETTSRGSKMYTFSVFYVLLNMLILLTLSHTHTHK